VPSGIKPGQSASQVDGKILKRTDSYSELIHSIHKLIMVIYKYKHASIIPIQNTRQSLLYRDHLSAYKHEHASRIFNSKYKT
jgi:hypothetical protein